MDAAGAWACLLVCLCVSASVKATDMNVRQTEIVAKLFQLRQAGNSSVAADFNKFYISNIQKRDNEFPCPLLAPSKTTPTSVHRLRPGDISVVAALGDSLTAGRGAKHGILGLLVDYRGLSWSIGGDDTYSTMATIPNIFKIYNPYIYGYSEGVGGFYARFNVATSGAKARDLPAQAEELVRSMRADTQVDFSTAWKVITIFIGANDLCDFCTDVDAYSAENYVNNLKVTLDYLQDNVPRAFVNLVEVLPVEIIRRLGQNLICQLVHSALCGCAATPREEARQLREKYQQMTRDLVDSARYNTRDDFTVVLQPFYRNTSLPVLPSGEIDFSYFASDCFHYSVKGQEATAKALWNNMVQPVGCKQTSLNFNELLECPTEEFPYLYTTQNSNTTETLDMRG